LRTLPPDLLAITISRLIKLSITSLLSY
jgi:hypothetical protein